MNQNNKISIVAPFFNEALAVSSFYAAMKDLFDSLPQYDFELVCVDDGSGDETLIQLTSLAQNDPRIQVIEFSRNFGKEAALSAGIDFSLGDAVIPIDVDLQDPPALIIQMISLWEEGAEVVLAKRIDRSSDTRLKRVTAALFYRLHNLLSSEVQIPENVGDFRLMDRVVVDALKRLPERRRFMKGLFAWVGFKTVSIEYVRAPRELGESKFSGWKLWNFALEGITSFSLIPLKVWTYLGILGALFAFFYAVFVIIKTLIFGIDLPGYASLLVVTLFFGSLQLISLGIIGEYIGRIYFESKGRPLYIVRKHIRTKKSSTE
jgi:glycosyltransferase involved in cell wall biosynthesis